MSNFVEMFLLTKSFFDVIIKLHFHIFYKVKIFNQKIVSNLLNFNRKNFKPKIIRKGGMLIEEKKKIIFAVAIIAVIAIMLIGEQTYARYMSKVTGKGSGELASWSFKVNENEQTMQNIYLKSTLNNDKITNHQLAPGTKGTFQIKLDASNAEVGINYVVKFENETRKPANLIYIYEGKRYKTLNSLQTVLTGTINANDEDRTRTFVINWEWPYETGGSAQLIAENDAKDTQDAKQLTDYSFDIVVTGTQVNPQV